MPTRTVEQGFESFHSVIIPSSYQSGKATSHKSSITSRLEYYYDLSQLFYSGSANNGTDVASLSDVDFFASIPTNKLKDNSSTSLREIKECLQNRFKSTRVYVDSPAIVLDFGSGVWDTAEVIPAYFVKKTAKGKNIYNIPNGSGGWMRSSPSTHNAYVTFHNNRLNKKLKPLIRFIKAWKYYSDVPISSFYLELRVTKLMEEEKSIIYDIDLNSIFQKLKNNNLAAIQDPEGISGLIYPCASDAAKITALSKLDTAVIRIQKAREAESSGSIKEAFEWWDKVFSYNFPYYYY